MPTRSEIQQTINAWLAVRWPVLVNRQDTYFAAHGRYFQGLWTHRSAPTDGAEESPDNLTTRPTDQVARWPDFLSLPDRLPCALRLDVYEGPQGHGWSATLRVRLSGSLYERTAQVGAESWRAHPWRQVEAAGTAATRAPQQKRKSMKGITHGLS